MYVAKELQMNTLPQQKIFLQHNNLLYITQLSYRINLHHSYGATTDS
jgi:hypothetical protein